MQGGLSMAVCVCECVFGEKEVRVSEAVWRVRVWGQCCVGSQDYLTSGQQPSCTPGVAEVPSVGQH